MSPLGSDYNQHKKHIEIPLCWAVQVPLDSAVRVTYLCAELPAGDRTAVRPAVCNEMHYLHGRCCHGTEFNRSVNRLGMFNSCSVCGTCFAGSCTAHVHGCPALTWVNSGSDLSPPQFYWTHRHLTVAPISSVRFSFVFISPFLSLHLFFPDVPCSSNRSPLPSLFSSLHFKLIFFIPFLLLLFFLPVLFILLFLIFPFLSSFRSAATHLIFFAHYFCVPF